MAAARYSCRNATIGSSRDACLRRVPAEEDADRRRDAERQQHRQRRDHRRPAQVRAIRPRAAITPTTMPTTPPARLSATASIRNCRIDVARARADRQAEADLARPLGHRQQHDVHDADAADEQRHRGDCRRAATSSSGSRAPASCRAARASPSRARRRCRPRRAPRSGGRPPVVSAWRACVMTVKSSGLSSPMPWRARSSLVISRAHARHVAGRRRGDRDVVQLRQVQQPLRRRERHVDGVELIVAGRRLHHPAGARTTPTTSNGWFQSVTCWPTGFAPAPNSLLARRPRRARRPARRDLLARGEEPAGRNVHARLIERHLDVGAVHAREPALVAGLDVRRSRACRSATYCTPRSSRIASASRRSASPRSRARPRCRRAAAAPSDDRASPSDRLPDGRRARTTSVDPAVRMADRRDGRLIVAGAAPPTARPRRRRNPRSTSTL